MSTRYIRDLGPKASEVAWRTAQVALANSDVSIGHIDTGVFPHPALGYAGNTPPGNILIDQGANLFDAPTKGPLPVTDLTIGESKLAKLTEFPDHGVKTMSVILSDDRAELRGVAPGAKIVPYRVANGPVFVGDTSTAGIGKAIDHAMALATPPRVFSISMGNPGVVGLFEFLRGITGGSPGMAKATTKAINKAYEAGIIIVCAGGQVINLVAYPARFGRTIAVGGMREDKPNTPTHYPNGGYQSAGLIDVWAMAANINRAGGQLKDGAIIASHADDPQSNDGEPSGTSYAAPQVAAAAAMWVNTHRAALDGFIEKWKIVEAFRKALRDSAEDVRIPKRRNGGGMVQIRRLDIDALLQTAPDMGFDYHKRRKVSAHASWL